MEKLIRHGDVLLRAVKSVPDGEKLSVKKYVVAEGEVTGHCHTLEAPKKSKIEVVITGQMVRYLVLSDTCQLRHQEHKDLRIEPGMYEIIQEQEYDYFEEQRKKVVD